jgi:hypothetical protein
MSRVKFEPTIPAFERVKTFHALDREATVMGSVNIVKVYFPLFLLIIETVVITSVSLNTVLLCKHFLTSTHISSRQYNISFLIDLCVCVL